MKDDSKLVTGGRDIEASKGAVNPPVYHASTIIFPTMEKLAQATRGEGGWLYYGRRGTPTTFALQDAIADLEGGAGCVIAPSGLAAVSLALMSFLDAGDHLLMTDSVYGPSRTFCDTVLRRFGVKTTYYDPTLGGEISDLMTSETKVVFVESPGSITLEIQDVPAISVAAHDAGATVIMDNTWATPLFFKPFEHGVDVSIQAATKYIVGHADAMLGTVTAHEDALKALRKTHQQTGLCAGPDDVYLALRGLRTLSARLARHQETALTLAQWMLERPEVHRVLHPALPGDSGHTLWQRDFTGSCGLFSVVLNSCAPDSVNLLMESLEFFGIGYSWGGYESLVMSYDPATLRTATSWDAPGPTLRFHAGLEDVSDLLADLEQGFAKLKML